MLFRSPGPHLSRLFAREAERSAMGKGAVAAAPPALMYGRVAEIRLGGRPAVELLEIAAPL